MSLAIQLLFGVLAACVWGVLLLLGDRLTDRSREFRNGGWRSKPFPITQSPTTQQTTGQEHPV